MKKRIIALIIILSGLAILSGCSKKIYVPVESERTEYRDSDTTGIYRNIRYLLERMTQKEESTDTVVDCDKETVVLNEQGDTTKHYRVRIVYKSSKIETELENTVIEQDSIINSLRVQLSEKKSETKQVTYPVEKELTAWQKFKMNIGFVAILLFSAALVFMAIKIIYRLKK